MLQIATGKYYGPGQYYETTHRGIIYTNYKAPVDCTSFETCIGTLTHITQPDDTNRFVFELVEKREMFDKNGNQNAVMSTLGHEMVSDFRHLTSFFLNASCVKSERRLEDLVGWSSNHSDPPLPRIFDEYVSGKKCDPLEFQYHVMRLIQLDRSQYVSAMNAIRRYVKACHRMVDDIDSSYALFVSAIESLAQKHDDHNTAWEDVAENKRNKFDKVLINLPSDKAEKIRSILVEEEHHAIARRFKAFCLEYLESSFYRSEAAGISYPASAFDMDQALKNTYIYRSKYLHTLKGLPEPISKNMFGGETVEVEGKLYLSFSGLARTARAVILNFVYRAPNFSGETFNYSSSIPGLVAVSIHRFIPNMWVHDAGKLNKTSAHDYLKGHLAEYLSFLRDNEKRITDMTKVMSCIEQLEPSLSPSDEKLALATLYFCYSSKLRESDRSDTTPRFLERYKKLLNEPSIYSLLVHSITGEKLPWEISLVDEILRKYHETRFHKNKLNLDRYYEARIYAYMAHQYDVVNMPTDSRNAVSKAIEACPGNDFLMSVERDLHEGKELPRNWDGMNK